jgi:hypothetical protein
MIKEIMSALDAAKKQYEACVEHMGEKAIPFIEDESIDKYERWKLFMACDLGKHSLYLPSGELRRGIDWRIQDGERYQFIDLNEIVLNYEKKEAEGKLETEDIENVQKLINACIKERLKSFEIDW